MHVGIMSIHLVAEKLPVLTDNDRIYTLELLRFIAALAVFFGHYVHFYMYFSIPSEKGVFYNINTTHGDLAVPVFFLISGAIFVHTYFDKIQNGEISFLHFMQKRFARLYPLHFFTLILVAILQAVLIALNQSYFIYQFNDAKHFLLNILFISHWGFEIGYGFNGPIWSVSHEVFLYVNFFMVCIISALIRAQGLFFILTCAAIAASEHITANPLVKSAFIFFVGATIYFALATLIASRVGKFSRLLVLFIFALLLIALDRYFTKHGLPYGAVGPVLLASCLTIDSLVKFKHDSWFCKISSFLGNISYSTYLLHFPVQLVFVIFNFSIFTLDFSSTYILSTYVIIVSVVAMISYQFYEKPMKIRVSEFFRGKAY